jgi:hypothetical protein
MNKTASMRSIIPALAWEYWRKCRWSFLSAYLCMTTLAAFIYSVAHPNLQTNNDLRNGYLFLFVWLGSISFMVALSAQRDNNNRMGVFPLYLYTRPLPTWIMVGLSFIFSVTTVSLLYLAVISSINFVCGVRWPILVTMLFWGAVAASAQAVIWFPVKSAIVRIGIVGGLLYLFTSWLVAHHGGLTSNEFWNTATTADFLFLGGCIIVSYVVALLGVIHDRRGGDNIWLSVCAWWERQFAFRQRHHAPFKSPQTAQFWFEWRQKGYILPLVTALPLVVILAISIFGDVEYLSTLSMLTMIPYISIPIGAFVVGLIAGRTARGKIVISPFNASRPMSTSALANAILKACTASILGAVVMCLLTILATFVVISSFGEGQEIAGEIARHSTMLIGVFIIWLFTAWGLMGLGVSMSLTGRAEVAITFFLSVLSLILLYLGCVTCGNKTVYPAFLCILSLAFLSATALAFAVAQSRGLVSSRLIWKTAMLWVLACALLWFQQYDQWTDIMLLTCLLALFLSPLALQWNRHR